MNPNTPAPASQGRLRAMARQILEAKDLDDALDLTVAALRALSSPQRRDLQRLLNDPTIREDAPCPGKRSPPSPSP